MATLVSMYDVFSDHNLVVAKLRMRTAALNTTGNKRRKVDVLKLCIPSNLQQYKDQFHSNLDNMTSPYSLQSAVV